MSLGLKTVFNTNQINTLENWINNLMYSINGAGIFRVSPSGAYQKYDNSGTPITNALADATSGDMIVLNNVTVSEENIILKNNVYFYFLNSTVSSSLAGGNPIFKDSGLACVTRFLGYGTITKLNSGECIKTTSASSNIAIFGQFTMGSLAGNCITSAGTFLAQNIYTLVGGINITGGTANINLINIGTQPNITQSAGYLYLDAKVCGNINQTGGNSWYNVAYSIGDITITTGSSNISYSYCGNVNISGGNVIMNSKGQSEPNRTLLVNINGGQVSINNAYLYTDSDQPNVLIYSGTVYLNNCRIFTNSPDVQYNVVKEGGTLVLDSCKLIGATNNSIAATTSQNVVCYNSYANKAKNANITIKAGTLTVDSSVI